MLQIDERIIINQFFESLRENGIVPKDNFSPVIDGEIHRFSLEGDRYGQKTGAYKIFADGWPVWFIQDFRQNEQMIKCVLDKDAVPHDYRPSHDDFQRIKAESERKELERLKLQKEKQQAATLRAWREYDSAEPCREHPYLKHKHITNFSCGGLKVKTRNVDGMINTCEIGDLLIPMLDAFTGIFRTLIHISANQGFRKLNYKDASAIGVCAELIPLQCREWTHIGDTSTGLNLNATKALCSPILADSVFICEGIATGFSVLEIMNHNLPVLCAGSCHNILHVAKAWRIRYPELKIIIAADNDNAGIQAAQKVITEGFADDFTMPEIEGYDWNDYLIHMKGKDI